MSDKAESIFVDGDPQLDDVVGELAAFKVSTDPAPVTQTGVSRDLSRRLSRRRAGSVHLDKAHIYGICLVGFDHTIGPTVEFTHPEHLREDEDLCRSLPFLALPDGAHAREQDYSYFHLLIPSVTPGTIFGISCNRQIASTELINKTSDVTRSTVQKAIVVLASKPIFGPLRDKLGVITKAFFNQKDFADKRILVDLYSSFHRLQRRRESAYDGDSMYMGTSLREIVARFRGRTLTLLKLLLLQRRTLFFAPHTPVERLCTFQYSLVSLVPSLLNHLQDAAAPSLVTPRAPMPGTMRTSDRQSLLRYIGFPLALFGRGAFFQPYLPLQQVDLLKPPTTSFVVGATNSIVQQQRDCAFDAIVDVETGAIDLRDTALATALAATPADRKWMDSLVTVVERAGAGPAFVGSDDFLRAKFEEYVSAFLAALKYADFRADARSRGSMATAGTEYARDALAAFGTAFSTAFCATPAYADWNARTDPLIFDLVEPRHPMEGKTNAFEDVGIRLAQGLQELHLEETIAPTRDALSWGLATGTDHIKKTYEFLRADLIRRQKELTEPEPGASEKCGGGEDAGDGSDADSKDSHSASNSPQSPRRSATDTKRKTLLASLGPASHGASIGAPSPTTPDTNAPMTNTVLAGMDVAKTGATNLAQNIGSFFSSRAGGFFSRAEPATREMSASPFATPNQSQTLASSLFATDDGEAPNTPANDWKSFVAQTSSAESSLRKGKGGTDGSS